MPDRGEPGPRLTLKERQYRALLAEQAESGLALREFAAHRGIAAGTLSWWKSEIRRREAIRHGRAAPKRRRRRGRAAKLLPVRLNDALSTPSSTSVFEVSLPGGAAVRVPADFDADAFARLVAVLNQPC